MKNKAKGRKLITLFILCMMMTTLTGCVSLQDIRDEQAIWLDAEKKQINWKGTEYTLLLDEAKANYTQNYNVDTYLSITEKDVPTLLAFFYGEEGYVSKDEKMITVGEKLYCKDEVYNELKDMLDSGMEFGIYGFDYYDEDGNYENRIFTKEESLHFETILEETLAQKRERIEGQEYLGDIYECSIDGLFINNNGLYITVYQLGDHFYIEDYNDYDDAGQYPVPKNYEDDMKKLFKELIELYGI